MSRFVISLLIALGAATWVYTRLQRNSGNNTRQSLVASSVVGLAVFIVVIISLGMLS